MIYLKIRSKKFGGFQSLLDVRIPSPIIYNKHAYLIGAGMRACFDLATGRLIRKVPQIMISLHLY